MNDKMNGLGMIIFGDGTKYKGEWKDNIMEGIGEEVSRNGNKFEG